MKITRANVEEYAKSKGLEPIQIDGIPEGFSFVENPIQIGDVIHIGSFVVFKPLADWSDSNSIIKTKLVHELVPAFIKK